MPETVAHNEKNRSVANQTKEDFKSFGVSAKYNRQHNNKILEAALPIRKEISREFVAAKCETFTLSNDMIEIPAVINKKNLQSIPIGANESNFQMNGKNVAAKK